MPRTARIVAHMIVGTAPEPYLSAALDSIADVCALAIVNDNSGSSAGANRRALERCALARADRLAIIDTPFTDFAAARNACIDATPSSFEDAWGLYIDADEVHGDALGEMARLLPNLPADVDAVDGYSRHFVGSFDWWRTIERRMCLFRLRPHRRWQGALHERLVPLGKRVVLPAVWFHYGYVITPQAQWRKSQLYSSLGQPGFRPSDEQVAAADVEQVWSRVLREAIRYRADQPVVMRPIIAALRHEWAAAFAAVDALVARQTRGQRLRNMLRKANYGRLIGWRAIEARVRWGWRARSSVAGAGRRQTAER